MSETDLEHQAERRAYWRSEADRLAAEKMDLEDEIARLREREEQQGNLAVALDATIKRAEAAEARVAELEDDWNRGAELDQARLAQIARLEEALREIATTVTYDDSQGVIARRALAHEEEKT